jgi:hypothetical protein
VSIIIIIDSLQFNIARNFLCKFVLFIINHSFKFDLTTRSSLFHMYTHVYATQSFIYIRICSHSLSHTLLCENVIKLRAWCISDLLQILFESLIWTLSRSLSHSLTYTREMIFINLSKQVLDDIRKNFNALSANFFLFTLLANDKWHLLLSLEREREVSI